MNPLKQFKQVLSDLKFKIRSKFSHTLGIKTIGDYKREIADMLNDLEVVSDYDVIDELIEELGIQGTAEQYIILNKCYKEYYQHIIKDVKKAQNVSNEFRNYARAAETKWEKTYKEIIQYLYDRKQQVMFGTREDVNIYHANSYSDEPLPWLQKEDINENRFNNDFTEGLFGLTAGATSGAVIAVIISSLSVAFHIHPKIFTGISTAVGALVGHFVQKHFFIDFTNYVKLKRYVTHYPESFEIICDLMSKNAVKFQQKDPVKYKKILMNLKRLQANPPAIYKNYLDDEIEAEEQGLTSDLFDVRDEEGDLIKSGTSEINPSYGYSNSNDRISRSSRRERGAARRALSRKRDIEMSDINPGNRYSNDELSFQTKSLLGDL